MTVVRFVQLGEQNTLSLPYENLHLNLYSIRKIGRKNGKMEMENGKPDWRLLRRSYCQEMFIILFSDHIWPICDPWLDNLTNGGTIGH